MAKNDNYKNGRKEMNRYSKEGGKYGSKKQFNRTNNTSSEETTNRSSVTNDSRKKFSRDTRNDPSWHIADDNIAKAVGNLSYATISGLKVNYFNTNVETSAPAINTDEQVSAVPGLCVLDVLPTIGIADGAVSAISYTANNLYTFVNKMNSRNTNYEEPDLMITMLATLSLYDLYWDVRRAYCAYNNYSLVNRYTPQFLIDALGYDFNDLILHQTDWWAFINTMGLALNQFPIPGIFPNMKRRAMLFSNLFYDREDVSKAQIYAFRPAAYYLFDATGSTTGGQLIPVGCSPNGASIFANDASAAQNRANKMTLDDIKILWNRLYDAMIYDTDIGIMGADIRKAYGDSALMYVSSITSDLKVLPYKDEAILMQIMNSQPLDPSCTVANATIKQSNGTLQYKPEIQGNSVAAVQSSVAPHAFGYPIFMDWDNPTYVDNIYSTRFRFGVNDTLSVDTPTSASFEIASCGTEIITGCRFYSLLNSNLLGVNFTHFTSTTNSNLNTLLWYWLQFEHAPAMIIGTPSGTLGDIVYNNTILWNYFDQYSQPLTYAELQGLHDQSLLAAFGVTKIGDAILPAGKM